MTHHVMLDLETMSTKPNAAIVAIGAVEFNMEVRSIGKKFYTRVSLASNIEASRDIAANTILWWMKQSDEARAEITSVDNRSLLDALLAFNNEILNWLPPNYFLWGNGANFDPVILGSAYEKFGFAIPWNFRNIRCYRTAIAILPQQEYIKPTVAHNALEDARAQAIHLVKIWR